MNFIYFVKTILNACYTLHPVKQSHVIYMLCWTIFNKQDMHSCRHECKRESAWNRNQTATTKQFTAHGVCSMKTSSYRASITNITTFCLNTQLTCERFIFHSLYFFFVALVCPFLPKFLLALSVRISLGPLIHVCRQKKRSTNIYVSHHILHCICHKLLYRFNVFWADAWKNVSLSWTFSKNAVSGIKAYRDIGWHRYDISNGIISS